MSMTNLSEDELTANNDAILEVIATPLGVSENHVNLDAFHIATDGTLSVAVTTPANAVKPDDFESQVQTKLDTISGLEDVIVTGKEILFEYGAMNGTSAHAHLIVM